MSRNKERMRSVNPLCFKEWRKIFKVTEEEIGAVAGVDRRSVSYWVAKKQIPFERALKIAVHYKQPINYIFGEDTSDEYKQFIQNVLCYIDKNGIERT